MKGEFNLFSEAEKNYNDAEKLSDSKVTGESYYQEKMRYIRNFKKVILICMHGAIRHYEKSLINEQEVLNNIAEMMMDTYVSESLALRVEKREAIKGSASLYRDMLDVNVFDTSQKVRKFAYEAIYSFESSEVAPKLIKATDSLTRVAGVNVKDARRRIADKLIGDNVYKF
jgi:hypothetical protein